MSSPPAFPPRPPRISPGDRRDVGHFVWAFATLVGRVAKTSPPNLFLTLGRHRRLFWGWLHFADGLMPGGKLPRRDTELVILRVAHHQGCQYEFDHHASLGRRAGLTAEQIDRVTEPLPDDRAEINGGWTPRQAAILATADALLAREDLDDDEWNRAAAYLDDRSMIELVLLVGHYRMLAAAITTIGIALDGHRD